MKPKLVFLCTILGLSGGEHSVGAATAEKGSKEKGAKTQTFDPSKETVYSNLKIGVVGHVNVSYAWPGHSGLVNSEAPGHSEGDPFSVMNDSATDPEGGLDKNGDIIGDFYQTFSSDDATSGQYVFVLRRARGLKANAVPYELTVELPGMDKIVFQGELTKDGGDKKITFQIPRVLPTKK